VPQLECLEVTTGVVVCVVLSAEAVAKQDGALGLPSFEVSRLTERRFTRSHDSLLKGILPLVSSRPSLNLILRLMSCRGPAWSRIHEVAASSTRCKRSGSGRLRVA
jgi:hypothetical protein